MKMLKKAKATPEQELVMPDYEGEMVEVEKERHVVNTVINIILVVAIILAAVCTYVSFVSTSGNGVPSILGVRALSIQTDSMYPTIKPGDLVLAKAIDDASELETGDIVTYWTVINGERVLNTHRITEIYDGGGYLIFGTKGDNSSFGDALTVHEAELVGKYWTRIGGIGKVFDFLQTSKGFFIVVVIPVFIFFIYHLIQFFRGLFEYQNVKNRIKYEQERGRNEDFLETEKKKLEAAQVQDRASMEAELRAKLKEELLADMKKEQEEAEAKAKAEAEAKAAAERAEAELREKLKAELLAELKKEQDITKE